MKQLQTRLEAILAQSTGRFGLVIVKASTQETIAINPDAVFPSASMIKVPIMLEVMRRAASGNLSLDTLIPVTREVKVDGGILQELRTGLPLTVRELVTLMIIVSDNTATNMLIELIGMEAVNDTMKHFGANSTLLRRKMMDFAAAKNGRENLTTAADMALLFEGLAKNSLGFATDYNKLMLDILKRQQIEDKLRFYLPAGIELAHKTGTLPGAEHDGGILYLPGGPYIISIFTDQLSSNQQGLRLVAKLGKCIYDYLGNSGLTSCS